MLFERLFAHAQSHPNDIAIHDDHGQYTWQQLAAMTAGLSMHLKSQTRQQRVGVLLPAGAGFVVSFYGTLLAGKCVVPINFLLGDREIAHVIQDSDIDTVVTIGPLAARLKETSLKIIDLMALPKTVSASGPVFPSPNADDLAVILYTSGTSGMPKGVMLSYGNLQSDVEACIVHAKLEGRHVFLGVVPLFHSTGMLATMIAPVQLGAQTIYIARFSPVASIKAIRARGISVVIAVPSMYGALLRLKDAGPDDFKNLYAAISGGEPLPANIREGFEQRFGKPLLEGYGLTETIGPMAFNTPQIRKPGSVGRPIPGCSVRMIDDDGNPLPTGETGEILISGPMIMKGYYKLPQATAEAMTADNYFKSGDLGFVDADGFLHITGRKKDLIITAGEKASPREIEEVLMQHVEVAEAAVLGKKDASRGEVVVAFVVPREGMQPTEEQLRTFVRDRGLAAFKVPREIILTHDLPRSPTGKVLKRVLAEQLNRA